MFVDCLFLLLISIRGCFENLKFWASLLKLVICVRYDTKSRCQYWSWCAILFLLQLLLLLPAFLYWLSRVVFDKGILNGTDCCLPSYDYRMCAFQRNHMCQRQKLSKVCGNMQECDTASSTIGTRTTLFDCVRVDRLSTTTHLVQLATKCCKGTLNDYDKDEFCIHSEHLRGVLCYSHNYTIQRHDDACIYWACMLTAAVKHFYLLLFVTSLLM